MTSNPLPSQPAHISTIYHDHKLGLTIEEAVRLSGIGRSKLYEAIRDGLLQARKFGRRTIILQEDLQQFLAALPKGGRNG
jgi:excisionase family DNA binding protein